MKMKGFLLEKLKNKFYSTRTPNVAIQGRESSFQDWCSDVETGWLREDCTSNPSATAATAPEVHVREGTDFERKKIKVVKWTAQGSNSIPISQASGSVSSNKH